MLLTLQAAMLIAFTTLPHLEPQVLPQRPSPTSSAASIPIDRFIVAGIVIVATIVIAVAYRWTRFGRGDASGLRERDLRHAARALARRGSALPTR